MSKSKEVCEALKEVNHWRDIRGVTACGLRYDPAIPRKYPTFLSTPKEDRCPKCQEIVIVEGKYPLTQYEKWA